MKMSMIKRRHDQSINGGKSTRRECNRYFEVWWKALVGVWVNHSMGLGEWGEAREDIYETDGDYITCMRIVILGTAEMPVYSSKEARRAKGIPTYIYTAKAVI